MPRTVKERFTEELIDASDALEQINARVHPSADLIKARDELASWKSNLINTVRGGLGNEVAKNFAAVHEFDTEAFSGISVAVGINAYKNHIRGFVDHLPLLNVMGEYPSSTRQAILAVDRCIEQLQDVITRSGDDAQAWEDNLRRWKDRAFRALLPYLGEEEAGQAYRDDEGLDEQALGALKWLLNLKEEMQRYPEDYMSNAASAPAARASAMAERTPDPGRVVVVHGRDLNTRDAMFAFLRALGLNPVEFKTAVVETRNGAPTIGEVVDRLFFGSQAAVVLLTGDDEARLRTALVRTTDSIYERELTPQARPNVLFEAGLAFARMPERTILVQIGTLRPFSDVAGRHAVFFDGSAEARNILAGRLHAVGCAVVRTGTDWLTAGEFSILDSAEHTAPAERHANSRQVPPERKAAMLRELSGVMGTELLISWLPGDAESRVFSEDIAGVFRAAGWNVDHRGAVASMDVEGVGLFFYADDCANITPPLVVEKLVNAFSAAGLLLMVRCTDDPGVKERIIVAVGRRQDLLFR
jgi:predicted nucleotide-binding protein